MARLQQDEPIFTDQDLQRIEQIKPQLPTPFRLAVAPPQSWRHEPTSEEELKALQEWGDQLKQEGIVSEFILLPTMLLHMAGEKYREGYLKSVRAAAARCRADAVVLVQTVTEVDSYVNPLSILDLTIAGMWIVPGHHREALTIVEGIVMDNRNECLYAAIVAEGKGSTLAPLMYADRDDAIRRSRVAAFRAFGKELVTRSRGLHGAAFDPAGRRYETPAAGQR